MKEKFADVPLDPDTRIVEQRVLKIAGYDAIYQKWNWDGLVGHSLIFLAADVVALSDQELEELLAKSGLIEGARTRITISRTGNRFAFVNFGFGGS